MNNKLIFLGTGGDSSVIGRGIRNSGGIVIQLEGSQFNLNPGPGCVMQMIKNKITPRETIAVIVTNNLLKNANDINALADAITLGGTDSFGVLACTESVLNGDVESCKDIPLVRAATKRYFERIISLNKYNHLGINNVEILPLKAKSVDPSGIGVSFSIPEIKVCFTSDTSYFEGMSSNYEGCDVLVINCKNPRSIIEKGAMNIEGTIKLISKINKKPNLIILTGFSQKILEEDVLSVAREIRQQTGCHVISAKDGLVVDLDQFRHNIKQMTLKRYD